MKLRLIRALQCGETATIGNLLCEGTFFCYTLEDIDRHLERGGVKVQNQTCIPRGIYKVVIDYSPHFNRDLPHILGVPGFEGVRIHCGNSAEDTEGCILVGSCTINDAVIGGSKIAFERLFEKLKEAIAAGKEITLEIV